MVPEPLHERRITAQHSKLVIRVAIIYHIYSKAILQHNLNILLSINVCLSIYGGRRLYSTLSSLLYSCQLVVLFLSLLSPAFCLEFILSYLFTTVLQHSTRIHLESNRLSIEVDYSLSR